MYRLYIHTDHMYVHTYRHKFTHTYIIACMHAFNISKHTYTLTYTHKHLKYINTHKHIHTQAQQRLGAGSYSQKANQSSSVSFPADSHPRSTAPYARPGALLTAHVAVAARGTWTRASSSGCPTSADIRLEM